MNETVKKISSLRNQLSCIDFKEHLSEEDYDLMHSLKNMIEELENQLKNVNLVCVEIDKGWYLTDNSDLCFSTTPTWFDNIEEAKEYLEKADMFEESKEKAKFIEKEFK